MPKRVISPILNLRHLRPAVKLGLDAACTVLALVLVSLMLPGPDAWIRADALWLTLTLLINVLLGLPRQHFRAFGFRDLAWCGLALVGSLLASALVQSLSGSLLPARTGLISLVHPVASLAAFVGWTSLRLAFRLTHDHQEWATLPGEGRITLIVGGGKAGLQVAQEIQRNRDLDTRIVGYLDDAPEKRGLTIRGIPVLGTTEDLPRLVALHGVEQVIIAIPSAKGSTLRRITDLAASTGAEVVTVPGLFRLLSGQTWKPELKPLSIEDLLRREPVELDRATLGERLKDAVVLVTGAGGSIGSEICRQVAPFRPSRLILLGRGEGSLWQIERELHRLFPGLSLTTELCDIRNTRRLKQVFQRWQPNVVFHTAAHKHVPYLEEHPEEAVENNLFGTQNVVQAAVAVQTHTFVNISTDKAINPTNVLGASKYMAERAVLLGGRNAPVGSRYVTVRFGNVLGSRGSVIPVFQAQIEAGGPLTVTHPDMKRYFMTIPEAAQLVLQAGLMGENGKVYVLDMGEPVRIVDLAHDLIRLAGLEPGHDIEVQFSGIRPGEKLYEEIFNGQEEECPGIHPKVREAFQKPIDPERLKAALDILHDALDARVLTRRHTILHMFKQLIPGYQPPADGLGKYHESPEKMLA